MAIYNYLFVSLLVLSVNVLSFFDFDTSAQRHIYEALLLFPVCFILFFKNSFFKMYKEFRFLLFFFLFFSIWRFFYCNDTIVNILEGPVFLASFPIILGKGVPVWKKITKYFFFFFLVEVFVSIIERVLCYNFFPWICDEDIDVSLTFSDDLSAFRSFGLLGHPLQNALIVTTIMSFILVSYLKLYVKTTLWILGFVAILCFNTRSSIVGNLAIFVSYVVYILCFGKNKKNRYKYVLALIFISLCSIYFLSMGLGGRLLEMGLFDDNSAQVRVDTFSIFDYYSLSDFLFGSSIPYSMLLYRMDLWATENFWIDFLLQFGLVFIILLILFMFFLLKKLYTGYAWTQFLFTFFPFILIASTNNSLSADWHPLFFFLLSVVIFNPDTFNKLVPSKYLIRTL